MTKHGKQVTSNQKDLIKNAIANQTMNNAADIE